MKIFKHLRPLNHYSNDEIKIMNKKMEKYYEKADDYPVYKIETKSTQFWEKMIPEILNQLNYKKKIKILEIGAAKTGFYNFLKKKKLHKKISFAVHDINKRNKKWYIKNKIKKKYFFDINKINEKFDIVFSTYVLEHVVNPRNFLIKQIKMLNKKGSIFIFCPRYDFPMYLNPSSRHFNLWTKIILIFSHIYYRAFSLIFKKSYFLIQNDLAAFHNSFYTDADSMHWVSKFELESFFKNFGLKISNLNIKSKTIFSKEWIVKKYLVCSLKITKS